MAKKILRILCLSFGAALIINGICMIIFANSTIGPYLTILLGLIFFLPALFLRQFIRLLMRSTGKIIAAIAGFLGCALLITTAFLYIYGNTNTITFTEDYLIILGCGVRGSEPTEPLRSRLDTALEYLERNDHCTVIVSGGQGNDEDIPESEAMMRYLSNAGIDPRRIIEEDQSTSTSENFKLSNKAADSQLSSCSVAFITNDFHIYRANSLAKLQGFSFTHLAAPTSWYNLFPSYLREYLAIAKMYIIGN